MTKEIVLPTERRGAVNYNPRLLVLYGLPKSGKSSAIASLDDNLIVDLEDGYRALNVMSVLAQDIGEIFRVKKALDDKMKETGNKPYRFITIDNATRLEEMSLIYAAALYRKTPMGEAWGLMRDKFNKPVIKDGKPVIDSKADIRTLPNGAGYLYLRKALKEVVHMFQPYCETLILVCHVKDKQIQMHDAESTELVVDLAGKLGDIICGEADAVGYIYREKNKTMLSFNGGDNIIREARSPHLRGKEFVVGESDDSNNLVMNLGQIFEIPASI